MAGTLDLDFQRVVERRAGLAVVTAIYLFTLASCASVQSPVAPQYEALAPTPASSVSEVIERMRAIDDALPDSDGLKWFNRLYIATTLAIDDRILDWGFFDPDWMMRLDIIFANYYFDALRAGTLQGTDSAPLAWQPLLKNRTATGITRLRFALAGMNAHINRDLAFGLVDMYQREGAAPDSASAHYADYSHVNEILQRVELQMRSTLLSGSRFEGNGHLRLKNLIVKYGLKRTRQDAWRRSQELWRLRRSPELQQKARESLDRATEFAGEAILKPGK